MNATLSAKPLSFTFGVWGGTLVTSVLGFCYLWLEENAVGHVSASFSLVCMYSPLSL